MKKIKVLLLSVLVMASIITIIPESQIIDNNVVVIPCGEEDLPNG